MTIAAMKTFDDIEVRRPELAESYLALIKAQPGRPLALFAPRRIGKTYFLENDLTRAAQAAGYVTVYADIWLQRNAPLEAINHALEEALDECLVPPSKLGKLAKTPVKKVGAASASVEFGESPARRALPTDPALRLDSLVVRLQAEAKRPILLMLDEIQTLGEIANGEATIASLRAVLQKRKALVSAVFTGSSQTGMAKIMSTAGAPMYQFAQLMDFPVLGEAFMARLSKHFASVHRGQAPSVEDLARLFERLGYKPALLKDVVKAMSAEGMIDVNAGLKRYIADDRHVAGWRALLDGLDPLERAVLILIARGMPTLAQDSLTLLSAQSRNDATVSKVRTAIERLRKQGVVAKTLTEGLRIEDPLLAAYLSD
jgi:uncharacterized protein